MLKCCAPYLCALFVGITSQYLSTNLSYSLQAELPSKPGIPKLKRQATGLTKRSAFGDLTNVSLICAFSLHSGGQTL